MSISSNPPQGTGKKLKTVSAGITASVTQTQGEVPLTSDLNQFSIVANDGDATTLPPAIAGKEVIIVNDGANELQIFPASGDDLGNGVNASIIMGANESIVFATYDTTNWGIIGGTASFHGEMYDENNTDVFAVSATGEDTAYHTNGMVASILHGWIFDIGGAGTSYPIASIADDGGGDILVTTTGSHGLTVGDIISQTNLSDAAYVGMFQVVSVPSATTYTVTAVFTATGTGTMDQAATLTAKGIAEGTYKITWTASATSETNNDIFDFSICNNVVAIPGSISRTKFGIAADFQTISGQAIVEIVTDDKISFVLNNITSGGDITIRNLNLAVSKI